jgi:hypothetical protein
VLKRKAAEKRQKLKEEEEAKQEQMKIEEEIRKKEEYERLLNMVNEMGLLIQKLP